MFNPDLASNAGSADQVFEDLRGILRDLGVDFQEAGGREIFAGYTPNAASYDPISVRFWFPEDGSGILAADGLILPLDDEPTHDLRVALNYLNSELYTFSFYVVDTENGPEVMVRQALLPSVDQEPTLHPREIQHALTGLCAQKAIFSGPLGRVTEGSSWRFVKEALKSVR